MPPGLSIVERLGGLVLQKYDFVLNLPTFCKRNTILDGILCFHTYRQDSRGGKQHDDISSDKI